MPGSAKYTLGGVFRQDTNGVPVLGCSPQLSRITGLAFFNREDRGCVGIPFFHTQKLPLPIVDPVAKTAEPAGIRVIKGDGADAGDALPEIDTQPGAILRGTGCQAKGGDFTTPTNLSADGLSAAAGRTDFFRRGNGFAVDGKQFISDF